MGADNRAIVCLFALMASAGACSSTQSSESTLEQTADASTALVTTSPAAAALVARIAARARRISLDHEPGGVAQTARVQIVPAGLASSFERVGDALRPRMPREVIAPKPARVELPVAAAGRARVEDERSHRRLSFALVGAKDVPAEVADGLVTYPGALDHADVVQRATAEGVEDYVLFARRPSEEILRYRVDLEGIASLRLYANTLQLEDDDGTPVLRVAPPYVIDAEGTRHDATLAVEGCAYSVDASLPYAKVAPGASSCDVLVRWPAALAYPLVVDPYWTTTGSLATARRNADAFQLDTVGGTYLFVTGGHNGTASLASVESCFIGTGTCSWGVSPAMTTARELHAGGPLASGGRTTAGDAIKSTERMGDTGAWTLAGDMTVARYTHAAVGTLVCGGFYQAGASTQTLATCDRNNGANSWAASPPMGTSRWGHTMTALANGDMLVTGGNTTGGVAQSTAERFSGTWAAAGTMSAARVRHAAALLTDGRVLVAGGGSATADLYTSGANPTFSAAGSMSVARSLFSLHALPNGRAVAIGGGPFVVGTTYADVADVFTGAGFVATASSGVARGQHASVGDGSRVWLIGGASGHPSNAPAPTILSSTQIFTLLPNGDPCPTDPKLCGSQVCSDGVCCNEACTGTCRACTAAMTGGVSGTCTNVPAAQDPKSQCGDQGAASCGTTGTCNGAGGCSLYASPTTCVAASCAAGNVFHKADVCNGSGTCADQGTTACAPGRCTTGGCVSTCTTDAECDPSGHCASGACVADRPLGAVCARAAECASSFCVDGVCCNSACDGTCQACSTDKKQTHLDSGMCGPSAAGLASPRSACAKSAEADCGLDGLCDGTGSCQQWNATTPCGAVACDAATNTLKGRTCDGSGTCIDNAGTACVDYRCKNNACGTTCTTSADCLSGRSCIAGKCTDKLANGAACTTNAQCADSACVSGICCNKPCGGVCEACDASGVCQNVVGAPKAGHGSCDAAPAGKPCEARACDGLVSTTCAAFAGADVSCSEPACANGTATLAAKCDGKGTCSAAQTASCGEYVCVGTACGKAPCASDAECNPKFKCDPVKKDCVPKDAATCSEDRTQVIAADGTPSSCAPFACQAGACKTSCGTSDDCSPGVTCETANGRCVPAPLEDDGGGCGCRTPAGGSGSSTAPFAALAILFVVARRRSR